MDVRALRGVAWGAGLLLAALLASFVWAGGRQSLGEGIAAVSDEPWGIVTLLDLYVGFAFVAAWIHALERRWGATLAWAVALCLLGNVATLAYVLLRLWRLQRSGRPGTLADLFTPDAARP